jgi:hypothetical protein
MTSYEQQVEADIRRAVAAEQAADAARQAELDRIAADDAERLNNPSPDA